MCIYIYIYIYVVVFKLNTEKGVGGAMRCSSVRLVSLEINQAKG